MRKIILGVLMTGCCLVNAFAAEKIDCKNPVATTEINYCAEQAYQAADKELNGIYKKLIAAAGSNAEKERLVNAQRAWITFRDKHCEFDTFKMREGTGYTGFLSMCLEDLTKQRIVTLKKLLNNP
jgi:uncharacterized protein YecT (DUF1311 family)